MSVRPSVRLSDRVEQPGYNLMKFDIWDFMENLSRKLKFHWNPQELRVLYMNAFSHLWQYLADFFLEWEMFQFHRNVCRETQNTYFMFSDFFSENHAGYEIMSKNMLEPERTQTIWRLRVAYWISKPTRMHARTQKYVILLFHGNSGFVNAPQCYVTRTLRVLFHVPAGVVHTRTTGLKCQTRSSLICAQVTGDRRGKSVVIVFSALHK
jgi:hypothetical protein